MAAISYFFFFGGGGDIIQKPFVFVLSEETHLVASALDRRQSLKLQKRIARAKANEDLEELEVIFVLFSFLKTGKPAILFL